MIGTIALVPQIVDATRVPVVASGGVMDGRGIAAALALGATAVQMGTAFLTCEEAGVSDAYKVAIVRARDNDTRLTRAFSGRPARGIVNRFMREPRLSLAAARRFGRPLISCNSLLPEIDHSTRRAHLAGCSGGQQEMTNGTASKMTNGTVSSQAGGSSLTLQYKNGKSAASQTIAIPSDIPVVAVEPGQLADLQTGAYVFVVATRDAGRALTAALVLAGKDGLVSRI